MLRDMIDNVQVQVGQEALEQGSEDRKESRKRVVFKSPWEKAIEWERAAERHSRGWTDRSIAITVCGDSMCDEDERLRRGHLELSLTEDGAQVVLTICRHESNGPDSDMAPGGDIVALLSLPEAEALGIALLVRQPGGRGGCYGADMLDRDGLEVPEPIT